MFESEPVNITELVQMHVPECKLERFFGKEVKYILPLQTTSKFSKLFHQLEQSSKSIDIEYFGISMTTLEEVFLRLCDNVDEVDIKLEVNNNEFHCF